MKAQVKDKIEEALNSVRPFLAKDGGNVELIDMDDNNVVTLKLLGACSGCSMSHMTMKAGIEEAIKKVLPEVKSVIAID
ncbi:MAG: NifU family protein [Bacteroidetes bacterium]|nr:NifU family protein [Bacteroidota bacterium]